MLKKRFIKKYARALWAGGAAVLLVGICVFSLPSLFIWEHTYRAPESTLPPFPVTVNPATHTIREDPRVEALFTEQNPTMSAAVVRAGKLLDLIATAIDNAPWYQALAASDARIVVIEPGFRKEQAANAFSSALGWDATDVQAFTKPVPGAAPALPEGDYSPGTYVVGVGSSEPDARAMVQDRFAQEILSRYATSTAAVVPLNEALTIASMLERETSDETEMRLISGIIWNRIFIGMRLQIDSTVQYAKATPKTGWWPQLKSKDKYIQSPYNTYENEGLPPAPIANPSIAAVLAALNPKKTSCLYYFHDSHGGFHCADTYAEHVALLKKYYGQGK